MSVRCAVLTRCPASAHQSAISAHSSKPGSLEQHGKDPPHSRVARVMLILTCLLPPTLSLPAFPPTNPPSACDFFLFASWATAGTSASSRTPRAWTSSAARSLARCTRASAGRLDWVGNPARSQQPPSRSFATAQPSPSPAPPLLASWTLGHDFEGTRQSSLSAWLPNRIVTINTSLYV